MDIFFFDNVNDYFTFKQVSTALILGVGILWILISWLKDWLDK